MKVAEAEEADSRPAAEKKSAVEGLNNIVSLIKVQAIQRSTDDNVN